jgi:hypothetical protein
VDDLGFPRTPDRLLKFCGTHVWLLEVFKTITSTCGPYYLGGSTTPGIRAHTLDQLQHYISKLQNDFTI